MAMLLRGLEAGVTLAGVIGDDPEGRALQSLLKDERIDTGQLLIVDKHRPTTTKERFVGRAANRHPHQILRVDQESRNPIDSDAEEWLATAIASRIPALGKAGTCPMWKYRAREIATGREIPVPLCPELEDFDAVLISDYGKGVCTPPPRADSDWFRHRSSGASPSSSILPVSPTTTVTGTPRS